MSRIRYIKPGFFTDDDLGECQPLARLLFAGLWTIADREGRLEDRPKRIKVEVLPYDDCDVDALLDELQSHGGLIERYSVQGKRYLAIPGWQSHQKPHSRELPSHIPTPAEHNLGDAQAQPRQCPSTAEAMPSPASRARVMGNGERLTENRDLKSNPPTTVDVGCEPRGVENESGSSQDQERDGLSTEDPLHPQPSPSPDAPEPSASDAMSAEDCGTCDGRPCTVREFDAAAYGPLRRAMLASLHPEQWDEVGKGGQLDAQLAVYGKRVCHACRVDIAEYERPQRDDLCRKALVWSVESLHGSRDVQAVIATRIRGPMSLLTLIGDRKLEELRRTKRDRRRKGEPRAIAECIPPPFAGQMPEQPTTTEGAA